MDRIYNREGREEKICVILSERALQLYLSRETGKRKILNQN